MPFRFSHLNRRQRATNADRITAKMSEKVPFERLNQPQQQGKSCWFYGCIIAAVAGLLGLVAMGFSGWWLYKKADAMVTEFTSETGEKLPVVVYTDAEIEALEDRIDTFTQSLTNQEPSLELELTDDDINALVAARGQFPNNQPPVHVQIEGDKIQAQLSVPLDIIADKTGLDILRGRFLNGEGAMKVSIVNGRIEAYLQDLEVNGKQVPEDIMKQIRNENMAKDTRLSPKEQEALDRFERIEIKDGKLIIVPKNTAKE